MDKKKKKKTNLPFSNFFVQFIFEVCLIEWNWKETKKSLQIHENYFYQVASGCLKFNPNCSLIIKFDMWFNSH